MFADMIFSFLTCVPFKSFLVKNSDSGLDAINTASDLSAISDNTAINAISVKIC